MEIKKLTPVIEVNVGMRLLVEADFQNRPSTQLFNVLERTGHEDAEIVLNRRKNTFFNINRYYSGNSWVKDIHIVVPSST